MNVNNYRAWAEINLDNICHNVKEVKKRIGKTKLMGVVKADGYGHGAVEISKTFLSCGVDYLAVSMLDEAIELREAGIKAPILIFGYTDKELISEVINYDITQTVYDNSQARVLNEYAKKHKKKMKVHVNLDTGMSRLGYRVEGNNIKEIEKLFEYEYLIKEGIYTHFAVADEKDIDFTKKQIKEFERIVNLLEDKQLYFEIKHVSNSAGTMFFEDARFNMTRCGLILYGYYPNNGSCYENWQLRPAMELKAKVIMVKTISKGEGISYGRTYIADKQKKVATVPIGYADGFSRRLQNKTKFIINNKKVNILGRICMDLCVVDVTNIDNVKVGDEVVIIGRQGNEKITVEDLAKKLDTINYEIICVIGRRIPRVYIKDGKVKKAKNYLIKRFC